MRIFFIKNCNYLSLGLPPSKENTQHLKTWHFLLFSIFALLDPDRIQELKRCESFADPDPKPW
jgi:hypothetical protein